MSITYQFMYCIFVFFKCILHQSIILLILIEMSYHLYIFFKTFTMYMYQCVCAYKIQMHINISEIKWYKAVWNIFILKYENCALYILFGNISKVLVCFLFLKMLHMLHLFIDNQNVLFFAVEIDLSMLNFSLSIVDSLFLIFKSSDFVMLNYAFTRISSILINSHNQMYILFLLL